MTAVPTGHLCAEHSRQGLCTCRPEQTAESSPGPNAASDQTLNNRLDLIPAQATGEVQRARAAPVYRLHRPHDDLVISSAVAACSRY